MEFTLIAQEQPLFLPALGTALRDREILLLIKFLLLRNDTEILLARRTFFCNAFHNDRGLETVRKNLGIRRRIPLIPLAIRFQRCDDPGNLCCILRLRVRLIQNMKLFLVKSGREKAVVTVIDQLTVRQIIGVPAAKTVLAVIEVPPAHDLV